MTTTPRQRAESVILPWLTRERSGDATEHPGDHELIQGVVNLLTIPPNHVRDAEGVDRPQITWVRIRRAGGERDPMAVVVLEYERATDGAYVELCRELLDTNFSHEVNLAALRAKGSVLKWREQNE